MAGRGIRRVLGGEVVFTTQPVMSYYIKCLPLDLLVVALPAELLDVLFTEALLCLTLFLKYLYGLVERFNGCPLHLDLLLDRDEQGGRGG